METKQPSKEAIGIAARIWTRESCEKITMVEELAMEFARTIDEYRDALIWCSGSADFGQGGQAEVGFEKIRHRLIDAEGDL